MTIAFALPSFDRILPLGLTVSIAVVVLVVADRALRRQARASGSSTKFAHHLIMLALSGVALAAIVLALPTNQRLTRSDLLALLGLVPTAVIAVSSTTFVANAMAGLMLRAVGNFSPGDFVRVGDQFGRITERGLFHTEIQTEDRDLATLPNLYLISNPVHVVRSSGTIISATVSLGYDVPHGKIEDLLVQAAEAAELAKPFVHVVDLGNFAVTYRLAGFLANINEQLSARSRLRACMLDTLHGAGVEIVSPTFMNQRPLDAHERIMPAVSASPPPAAAAMEATAESLAFDKAEHVAAMETMRSEIATLAEEIEELEKRLAEASEESKGALQRDIEQRRARRAMLLRGLEVAEKTRGE